MKYLSQYNDGTVAGIFILAVLITIGILVYVERRKYNRHLYRLRYKLNYEHWYQKNQKEVLNRVNTKMRKGIGHDLEAELYLEYQMYLKE